jgi:hypothetical protein
MRYRIGRVLAVEMIGEHTYWSLPRKPVHSRDAHPCPGIMDSGRIGTVVRLTRNGQAYAIQFMERGHSLAIFDLDESDLLPRIDMGRALQDHA